MTCLRRTAKAAREGSEPRGKDGNGFETSSAGSSSRYGTTGAGAKMKFSQCKHKSTEIS